MRLPDRLRRVWRWAASLLDTAPSVPLDAGASPRPAPLPPRPSNDPSPISHAAVPDGDVVVAGDVEVRLWRVAGLVILATSREEARRALATLLAHVDPAVRREAHRLLETIREEQAAAA